jgi:hypothetical protein
MKGPVDVGFRGGGVGDGPAVEAPERESAGSTMSADDGVSS